MADPNKLPSGGANGSADDAPGLFDEPSVAGPTAAKSQGRSAGPASTGLNSDASAYFHPGAHAPLAVRMRPRNLDEVVGQDHLLAPGAPLRRLVEGGGDTSVILFGPPGTGKTTLASLISAATGRHF